METRLDPLKILFENEHIIAVDKDRNMAVHGGSGIPENETLLYHVKKYLGSAAGDFVTPAHRLDRNTRGPVLFAKDRETAKLLNRAFSGGKVRKVYHALLGGKLTEPLFIEADVIKGRHKKSKVENLKVRSGDIPNKEEWLLSRNPCSLTDSGTFIRPLQFHGQTTLCSIETWTGRYHQIRAVCEAAGYPVCGDNKYNHDPMFYYNRRTSPDYPDNQMLICKELSLPSLGINLTSGFKLVAVKASPV